jgi:hypothetical protein
MPLSAVGHGKIVTLEGLGTLAKPHPLQQAFIDEQAVQCGYCINGMIMQAAAFLTENKNPTEAPRKPWPTICAGAVRICALSAPSSAPRATSEGRVIVLATVTSRRDFLKGTGALIVSFSLVPLGLPACSRSGAEAKTVAPDEVDAFLAIDPSSLSRLPRVAGRGCPV